KGGMSAKQAQAIADTADKLAGKAPAQAAPAKPEAKPETKTADAKPAETKAAPPPVVEAPEAAQTADGHLIKNGAVIAFKGAGTHTSAVFVRGLTAWIVLVNTPDIDAARLKTQLGDFATQVEASAASGISVLRVGLKQPAQIAAENAGADLKVT